MTKHLLILVCVLFTSLAPRLSAASSVTGPTQSPLEILQDLIEKSPLVVAGRVTKLSSRYASPPDWFPPTSYPPILTDVALEVIAVFRGEVFQSTLTVVTVGGCIEKDQICFVSDISPSFDMGEQLLLFLTEGPEGDWILSDPVYARHPYEEGKEGPLGVPSATFRRLLRAR